MFTEFEASLLATVTTIATAALAIVICGKSRPKHRPKKGKSTESDRRRRNARKHRKKGKKSGSKSLSASTQKSKTSKHRKKKKHKSKSSKSSKTSSNLSQTQSNKNVSVHSARSAAERRKNKYPGLKSTSEREKKPAPTQSSKSASISGGVPKNAGFERNESSVAAMKNHPVDGKVTEPCQDDLRMSPIELRWKTSGGLQKVLLTNPTSERRAIKVKCSDNSLYRVNPVYSFIEPGQVLNVDIIRENGGAKIDKMVFLAAKATEKDKEPRDIFRDRTQTPMMVLPLIAAS